MKARSNVKTYRWKGDDLVGEKVAVQTWQVGTSISDELKCVLDIQADSTLTFDCADDLVRLLLDDVLVLSLKVLDDLASAIDGSQGRDVVVGGILAQAQWVRRIQESLVDCFERHFDGVQAIWQP